MRKAEIDKMIGYLSHACQLLERRDIGSLPRARLDVSVVLEKLAGAKNPLLDQLPELSEAAQELVPDQVIWETKLDYVNDAGDRVTMGVRNVGDKNPKAEIQIWGKVDKGPGRSRRLFNLSVPSSHYADFAMGIMRR